MTLVSIMVSCEGFARVPVRYQMMSVSFVMKFVMAEQDYIIFSCLSMFQEVWEITINWQMQKHEQLTL